MDIKSNIDRLRDYATQFPTVLQKDATATEVLQAAQSLGISVREVQEAQSAIWARAALDVANLGEATKEQRERNDLPARLDHGGAVSPQFARFAEALQNKATSDGPSSLADIRKALEELVIGHPRAKEQLAALLEEMRSNPRAPAIPVFIEGDPSTGVTTTAEAIARAFGKEPTTVIGCKEDALTTLIGVPPGFVGSGDFPTQVEELSTQEHPILTIDEANHIRPGDLAKYVKIVADAVEGGLKDYHGNTATMHGGAVVVTGHTGTLVDFKARLQEEFAARWRIRMPVSVQLEGLSAEDCGKILDKFVSQHNKKAKRLEGVKQWKLSAKERKELVEIGVKDGIRWMREALSTRAAKK